ncbi:MAG: protoporphyrinogen oxidase [Gemmatales bacterium]|nr:MAG: protoporphyrinogen oxidase [Gemmatales bacterium]
MKKVIIVGAGISGLSLAYRLQAIFPDGVITVLERLGRPGGTIWTHRQDGFSVELGPNGFLDNKPSTLALSHDLGLERQLIPASDAARRFRYLCLQNRLVPLPGGLIDFIQSDLLSWRGKVNLLCERFRRPRSHAKDETVDAFVRRRAGREAAELLADALVTGIYAGDPSRLSMTACFPRLVEWEKIYGSVSKGLSVTSRQRRADSSSRGERRGSMWSFADGLRLLVETLADRLKLRPVYGVCIRQVFWSRPQGLWAVRGDGQEVWYGDVVVLACPAYQQAALLADFDTELANEIGAIAYNRLAVVALGFRRDDVPHHLNGFGYIIPQRARTEVLGVQWCSSIYPRRAPGGMVLLRAMCGGWNRPEVAGWEDDRLLQAVRAQLHDALGIVAAPVFHHIVRWDRAIPQYLLGHRERVARVERRLQKYPGLFLAGNAYHGVALNDCTERASVLAADIARYLKNSGHRSPK